MIGLAVGIPASSLCMIRRMYLIVSTERPLDKADKRKGILIDLCIGIGLPIIQMILAYIPQGQRFDIVEDYGCAFELVMTWVGIVLVSCPPIIIGLISWVYCIMSIRIIVKRRSDLQVMLSVSASEGLNTSRYIRLIALAGVEMLVTVPWTTYFLVSDIMTSGVRFWSWSDTHWEFSEIPQYPAVIWKGDYQWMVRMELSRWGVVMAAFVFFGFFGVSEEAILNYRLALRWIKERVGSADGKELTLPTSRDLSSKDAASTSVIDIRRRDSLDSLPDDTLNVKCTSSDKPRISWRYELPRHDPTTMA